MRSSKRGQSGFTIIELILTVVILAIVVAIGAPSFQDLILSTRIKNAASDIYGTLIFARSEAIKRGTNITIAPVSGSWINGWTVKAGSLLLRQQDPISRLKIDCPSGTTCAQTIVYRRDGRLTSAGTISFVVDESTPPSQRRVSLRCVNVGVSGQINVLSDNNLDGSCSNG